MGKTKVMGLKVLKSGKFRIRDQVFFIPNQGLFCYATQPSSYVTVKQTKKKKMGRMEQMFPVKAGHRFSKEQLEKWYKYT